MSLSARRRLAFGLAWLLILAPHRVCGDDRFVGMDPYIREALKTWEIPGLAIAIVNDDETVLARGYGECEIGGGRRVSADTVFPIASCTKSFMAAAVGLLVEEGKLAWDDPVAKHLPGFELSDRYLTEHVTLRDLLCHRTGLRRADLLADGAGFDAKEIVRRLKHLEPIAELRTQFIYNNHMYTVLGEVVTRVSGQPWEQFVAGRIFRPLDMKSTTDTLTTIGADRLAPRHWRSDAGIVARPADGDMYSTVRDMAHWLKLQLAEGTYGGRSILKPETVREMHALQFSTPVTARPKNNVYAAQFLGSGLGWSVQDYRGRKVVSHGGAWGAMVAMMPEEKLGVVVLSNLDLEYLAALLTYDVFDAYLVGPEVAWNRDKWEATWLRHEPPGAAYRPRDEAKARLEKTRTPGTKPSLPLEKYAGAFGSELYGRLVVRHEDGRLLVTFGPHTTELSHWQDDSFYVRAPTRLTFDWLLTFAASRGGAITRVTVKHLGWDKDEKDQVFVRDKAAPAEALEKGVRVEFPEGGYRFTLGEAAGRGVEIEYKIVVDHDYERVSARPFGPSFREPAGPSGLHPREQISGNGQHYCLEDFGLAPPPKEVDQVFKTLKKGTYLHSFEWDGRNWRGPSDTSTPKGKPFPAGTYDVTVTLHGVVETDKGKVPYQVSGKTNLELK